MCAASASGGGGCCRSLQRFPSVRSRSADHDFPIEEIMTTKRIKLPQRSKAPGELRYKLFRCGLCEDVTSSDGALRAGSPAFENSHATFAGVDQLRARPHSGRETLVNPTRSDPRSTASRRQLSSN